MYANGIARDVFYGPKIYSREGVVNYEYIYLCCRMDRKELVRVRVNEQNMYMPPPPHS